MTENVDPRITPSLHPDNIKAIDGYDDDTAPFLAPAMTAFSGAYEGIRATWVAREAAAKNPAWNEASQIIQTDEFAQKQFARIAKGFDSVRGSLDKSVGEIERQLSAPLESRAAQSVAGEIREYVKNLPSDKRQVFLKEHIDAGDVVTASSVLGAPSYLSGLDAKLQQTLTRMWHERQAPALAKRLKAMHAAKEMIEKRAGLVFVELEKVVGVPPHKAKALRDAKTNAEKAFVLQS